MVAVYTALVLTRVTLPASHAHVSAAVQNTQRVNDRLCLSDRSTCSSTPRTACLLLFELHRECHSILKPEGSSNCMELVTCYRLRVKQISASSPHLLPSLDLPLTSQGDPHRPTHMPLFHPLPLLRLTFVSSTRRTSNLVATRSFLSAHQPSTINYNLLASFVTPRFFPVASPSLFSIPFGRTKAPCAKLA
ncbi:hypothetical protein BJV74DRAFT_572578 [Russula compacta]|nr:hypothetical protein BJV74DRAFT_572578 [Russula compacta]